MFFIKFLDLLKTSIFFRKFFQFFSNFILYDISCYYSQNQFIYV